MRTRLRALFSSGEALRLRPVKGRVQNVIVVHPADRRFREALFILRDDYLLSADQEPEELLRQARQAAIDFCGPVSPPPRRGPLWAGAALLLLAAAGALIRLTLF